MSRIPGFRVATASALVLTALLFSSFMASAAPVLGSTGAPDRTLRIGCHHYQYHYQLASRIDDFMLETYLVNAGNRQVSSGSFISPADPSTGKGTFRLCSYTNRPGIYTIKAKLTYRDGYEEFTTRLKPSHFTLRKVT